MRIIVFALLLGYLLGSCKSQKTDIKNGRSAYERKLYHIAAGLLQKEYDKEKNPLHRQETAFLVGRSFDRNNQPENAAYWYLKASKESGNYTAEALFRYAQMLKKQELYDSAINAFSQAAKFSNAFNTRKEIKSSRDALKWKNEFTRVRVQNLEKINSPQSDFAPALYQNKLVFTSSRSEAEGATINGWTGEKFGDLFVAGRNNQGMFVNPTSFSKDINTDAYEGSACFSPDGKSIFFTRCKAADKTSQYCHIYFSTFDGVNWSEPLMLELFPDTFNVGHPAISKNGKLLVVSSDYNGFGGKDIFYFTKTDTGWSRPSNAGSTVNTTGDEMFPWLDEKDNLYFASDGFPGMGGLDIFKAQRLKNGWKQAENLKYPINSGADDFAFIIEKYRPSSDDDTVLMTGYFSSSRKGGKGSDDLYRFDELWINQYELRGRVVAKQFEDPQNPDSKVLGLVPLRLAKCVLANENGDSLGVFITDTAGIFIFQLSPNTNYRITASRNEYFSNVAAVSTVGKRSKDSVLITLYTEIELEKIFTTKEIVIPNIYYDYDKATLRPESMQVLDSLVAFFNQNKAINVEIGSHTDSRGSDEYNLRLSQARAQSVVDYLIQKGIDRSRLIAKGYGETKPVNGCVNGVNCSEEEHQKNRRTTFRVTATNFTLESIEPTQIRVVPKPGEEEESEE